MFNSTVIALVLHLSSERMAELKKEIVSAVAMMSEEDCIYIYQPGVVPSLRSPGKASAQIASVMATSGCETAWLTR
jgi:hypothetical protein